MRGALDIAKSISVLTDKRKKRVLAHRVSGYIRVHPSTVLGKDYTRALGTDEFLARVRTSRFSHRYSSRIWHCAGDTGDLRSD